MINIYYNRGFFTPVSEIYIDYGHEILKFEILSDGKWRMLVTQDSNLTKYIFQKLNKVEVNLTSREEQEKMIEVLFRVQHE